MVFRSRYAAIYPNKYTDQCEPIITYNYIPLGGICLQVSMFLLDIPFFTLTWPAKHSLNQGWSPQAGYTLAPGLCLFSPSGREKLEGSIKCDIE